MFDSCWGYLTDVLVLQQVDYGRYNQRVVQGCWDACKGGP